MAGCFTIVVGGGVGGLQGEMGVFLDMGDKMVRGSSRGAGGGRGNIRMSEEKGVALFTDLIFWSFRA